MRKSTRNFVLIIIILLNGVSFIQTSVHNSFSTEITSTTEQIPSTVLSNDGPRFDYYIRQIDAKIPWDNLTLDFDIRVKGLTSISEVTHSYSFQNEDSWQNITMTAYPNKEDFYRCTNNFFLPDRANAYSWWVKYYAQDSDGSWSVTEPTNITLSWYDFPDTPRSTRVNSPEDIIYELGTLGHTIEWDHQSQDAGQSYEVPEQYMLRRDGSLIEWMQWPNGGLSVNIDGLSIGTYKYELTTIIGTPWMYTYVDEVIVDVVTGVPGEGSNPTMKYYLRKYISDTSPHWNASLTLQILVEDSDGVEEVLVLFSFDDGPWSNSSMTSMSSRRGWYGIRLDFPGFEEYETHSCDARYAAKDTLGNWAMTPLCPYAFTAAYITADTWVEVYDTPDLWYLEGTTGHTITWSADSGFSYSLYEDSHLVEKASWSGSYTLNVDALECGDHLYKLYVSGGGWGDSDNVTVHVVNSTDEIPFGAYTDSVGPDMPFNTTPVSGIPWFTLAIILALLGVALIVISCRFLKR